MRIVKVSSVRKFCVKIECNLYQSVIHTSSSLKLVFNSRLQVQSSGSSSGNFLTTILKIVAGTILCLLFLIFFGNYETRFKTFYQHILVGKYDRFLVFHYLARQLVCWYDGGFTGGVCTKFVPVPSVTIFHYILGSDDNQYFQ